MRPSATAWLALCLIGAAGFGAAGCGSSTGDSSSGNSTSANTGGGNTSAGGSASGASRSTATSASASRGSSSSVGSATSDADAGHEGDASLGTDASQGDAAAGHDDAGAARDGAAPDGASPGDAGHTDAGAPDGSLAAIPLKTPDGTYYTAQVTVGSQTFTMDIDTGSATAAVAGTGCTSCTTAGISTLYMPSSTAADQHKTSMSTYADGSSWSGEVYQDTVGLGFGTPNVQLELVSIQTQSQFFGKTTFQGILGLGPSELVTRGTNAYLSQEFADGITPIAAFELCAASGTMWLGGFDPSAAASAMQYTPLIAIGRNNPFYAINVDDLSIGGKSLGLTTADFQSPIVDTGTSLFYLPTNVFDALLSAVNASSGYQSVFATPLSGTGTGCVQARGVTAATVDAQLPAMAVSLPSSSGGADLVLTLTPTQSYLFDAGAGTFCLAAGDGGAQQGGIFGDSFLASFVTVIDQVQGRVGFATDAGCNSALSRRVVDLNTWSPRHPRPHTPLRR